MKTDTKELSAQIRQFNRWRRGDGALARDSLSKDIGRNATKALAAWKEARHE